VVVVVVVVVGVAAAAGAGCVFSHKRVHVFAACLCIYGSFNDAISSSDYIHSRKQ